MVKRLDPSSIIEKRKGRFMATPLTSLKLLSSTAKQTSKQLFSYIAASFAACSAAANDGEIVTVTYGASGTLEIPAGLIL